MKSMEPATPSMPKMKGLKSLKVKAQSKLDEMAEGPDAEGSEGDAPEPYEIENAAHHLLKAEEIKANKSLMNHVNKHLAKKKHAIGAIMGKSVLEATPEKVSE